MASTKVETPVLIVGGGPIGLALAADLGRRGVTCLIIEQSDGVLYHPRATALNARTMELMRRLGVAERVKRDGTPPDFPHTALYLTGFRGYEIARIDRPSHGGSTPSPISPERPQRCNQLWLDPILRDLATSFPTVTLRYRCRFDSLVEQGDRVIATVRDLARNETETIAAQYVVDCSGSHSPLRRAFNVKMIGHSETEYHLSVFMRLPELWRHHDKGKAALTFFVDEKGSWRNLVMIDGKELYRFGIAGKEFYDNPDAVDVEKLFNEVASPEIPREVISVIRWTACDIAAAQYQFGRVFLAGDAAHQNHPSGGFGLNTGMGDVDNIGWKLAARLKGWGGATLLDSYSPERQPIGVRNISQAYSGHVDNRDRRSHPEIAQDTDAGRLARAEMQAQILDSQPRMVLTDGIALGYRYDPSPIVWPDGTQATPDTISEYLPTARPGSRAPHAWLSATKSTVDLYGQDFTLLRFADAPESDALEQAFRRRHAPLTVAPIADPAIAQLYERKLALVRPDGHVAWRGDHLPDNPAALAAFACGAAL